MALHEMRYLHQHPAVIRILLGILVVPLVYAVTFLASVWSIWGTPAFTDGRRQSDRPVTEWCGAGRPANCPVAH